MIRRNTAGQVIYLPQLTTTDGTAITSSATLTVAKDGSEASSGGTLAHSANGVWKYTPTQAETDAAIVGLILTGTSAVPVVLNLITTGADTSAVALGANTTTPLDAAGTRSAVGLASANLDTQLADIPTVAEFEARSLPSADYFIVGDYTTPLDAAGVRAAVGLASANLDTQIADIPTVAEFEARTLIAASYFDPAVDVVARVTLVDTTTTNSDMRGTDGANTTTPPTVSQVADEVQTRTIARVTLVDTTTTNSDMRGTDNALLAASYTAPANADITAIKAKTDNLPTDPADQSAVESAITAATSPLATSANLAIVAGYLDTEIAAILADTNELQTDWANGGRLDAILDARASQASVDTIDGIVDEILMDTGTTLPAAIAAIEGGGGLTGDYTLTVAVTDDADSEPIEGATVTLYRSGERGAEATDANGEAVFGVDAATWTWIVRASGYASQTGTKAIAANDTLAVELVAIVVEVPTNPAKSALHVLCVDEDGEPEVGVVVDIRIIKVPSGSTDIAFKASKQTATSDANGTASFEAYKNATYQIKRGTADEWETITIGSGDTTSVTSFIGAP